MTVAGWSGVDRRQFGRMPTEAPVLVVPRDPEYERFWARAEDVSRGGLFISTSQVLPEFVELRVKILPPTGREIHARVRVVRQARGVGLGCCFVHLSPASQFRLDRWLGRTGGLQPISGLIHSNRPIRPDSTPTPS